MSTYRIDRSTPLAQVAGGPYIVTADGHPVTRTIQNDKPRKHLAYTTPGLAERGANAVRRHFPKANVQVLYLVRANPTPPVTTDRAPGWTELQAMARSALATADDRPIEVSSYFVGRAQVLATLAVAAAVREADPHSGLQRICDMLNELRTTV